MELASEWYALVEKGGATGDLHDRVQRTLAALLPQDVDRAAAAPIDRQPAVLALKDANLFVVRPVPNEGMRSEVHVDYLPIVPGEVRVSVTDTPSDLANAPVAAHYRRWEFIWSGGARVVMVGVVRRFGGFEGPGPDPAEQFARVLAGRAGWDVPASS